PLLRPRRVHPPLRAARGSGARGTLPGLPDRRPGGAREGGLGRRLVPARVLRRWDAARLGDERRVPDRRARPGVGGHLRRCPAHHARTREAVDVYRVEPYVVVADIYGVPPHVGRGGWTWYTGSAGWMFRVALESVLGVTLEGGDTLRVAPCIPDTWSGFKVKLRLPDGKRRYEV